MPAGDIPGFAAENVIFDAGFDASWEVNVFGRNASSRHKADADLAARRAARDDALVSLLSEVARNYFELRQYQGERAIALRHAARQQDWLAMTLRKHEAGEASDAEVAEAQAQLAMLQSAVPALGARIEARINAAAILLGEQKASLHPRLLAPAELPEAPAVIASGLTSDLLRRRPDVRLAEALYMSAESGRRLAELALYPSFNLIGSAGIESVNLSNFFDPGSIAANIGALFSWSLYDGGSRSAERTAASERSRQAARAYRGAVLGALAEVETDAASYVAAGREAREQLVGYAVRRFEAGTNNRLHVISARNAAANAEQALLGARARQLLDLLRFHNALGGGWRPFEPDDSAIFADAATTASTAVSE